MTITPKFHLNAQLLYVIAIAWFVAAIGCFIRSVGALALVFAALGLIHLIWAIVVDIKETNASKSHTIGAKKTNKKKTKTRYRIDR